jgi:hypothetical protein
MGRSASVDAAADPIDDDDNAKNRAIEHGGWIRCMAEVSFRHTSASWRLNYWGVRSIRNVRVTVTDIMIRAPVHVCSVDR